jgi:hypothetical protein
MVASCQRRAPSVNSGTWISALLHQAAASKEVTTVRATISPENPPPLRVVTAARFRHVGEQWDEVDGTELISEKRPPSSPATGRRRPTPGGPR